MLISTAIKIWPLPCNDIFNRKMASIFRAACKGDSALLHIPRECVKLHILRFLNSKNAIFQSQKNPDTARVQECLEYSVTLLAMGFRISRSGLRRTSVCLIKQRHSLYVGVWPSLLFCISLKETNAILLHSIIAYHNRKMICLSMAFFRQEPFPKIRSILPRNLKSRDSKAFHPPSSHAQLRLAVFEL